MLYVFKDAEYQALACLTDCRFEINNQPIEIAPRTNGQWDDFDYGEFSWSASASALFANSAAAGTAGPWDLTAQQINRQRPQIRFILTDGDGIEKMATGSVVITRIRYAGDAEGFAVFEMSMDGSGPLTIT